MTGIGLAYKMLWKYIFLFSMEILLVLDSSEELKFYLRAGKSFSTGIFFEIGRPWSSSIYPTEHYVVNV